MKQIDFSRNIIQVSTGAGKWWRNIRPVVLCLLLGCALEANAQGPRFEWAENMGGNQFDQSLATAADNFGNAYVTGFYADTAIFHTSSGTISLISAGYSNGFLAKYGPNGDCLWAKTFGGSNNDQGNVLTVDDKGNIYIGGSFSSPNFTPPGSTTALTNAGSNDAILMKYDSAGNFRWAKTMGGSDYEIVYGIAVDKNYNVFVTGNFGSTNFGLTGTSATLSSQGQGDVFIAKYDSSGNYGWAKDIGGTDNDENRGVAVDDSSNIYITGFFNSSADFDPGTSTASITSLGVSDIYIAKYDSNGNYKWATSIETGGDDYGMGIAVDRNGNAYITGYYSGQAYFPPNLSTPLLTPLGSYDVVIAKYDRNGTNLWAKSIGSTGYDQCYGIALDGGNNVYITGALGGLADFDPGAGIDTLSPIGYGDVFVAKYDPNGNHRWARHAGGNGFQSGEGIDANNNGDLFVTGYFLSTPIDFNPGGAGGQLTPLGGSGADGFLVKYACGDTNSSHLTLSECGNQYTLNGIVYTASGIYTQVFPNTSGCDSTITVDLTLSSLNALINVNGNKLSTTMHYATYQWLKDGALLPGETDSILVVTANGDYQVIVTNGHGCTDTSDVYTIDHVGVGAINNIQAQIKVYPNPAGGLIHISSPVAVNVILTTLDGRNIMSINNAQNLSLKNLAEGVYFLRIVDQENNLIRVEKIVKE